MSIVNLIDHMVIRMQGVHMKHLIMMKCSTNDWITFIITPVVAGITRYPEDIFIVAQEIILG